MHPLKHIIASLLAVWLSTAVLSAAPTAVTTNAPAAKATPATAAPVKKDVRRSVFVVPANAKEGRDPFFPDSSRVYDSGVPATHSAPEVTSLVCKGVSGLPGHMMAIINNHTFAVGDEGDVMNSSGRIHIRCVSIKNGFVVVEAFAYQ